jgi:hypothetical protein
MIIILAIKLKDVCDVYVLSTAHEDIMGETLVQEEPRKRKHQLQ